MQFGPTSIRLSGVLARGLQRPKLRADLKVSKQTFAGEVSYVIKIPETDSFNRIGEFDWEVLALCDGTRTPAEIAAELNEKNSAVSLSAEEVTEFLAGIDANTWERSPAEKNLCILEKIRDERRERVNHESLLYIYFSAFDPDKVLTRLNRYLGWLFTRQFFIASLGIFLLAAILVGDDFTRFRTESEALYNFSNKGAGDILLMWVLLFLVVGPHEFAHGLACKHYGGEVHHMGFMLMYFAPSFYTDCTDMHLFDSTNKRMWTIIAGVWITILQCSFAIFLWHLSPPGSVVGDVAYKLALMSGIPGFMQMNPLMKLDGYYVLSQYLQLDNLRERSFDYTNSWFRRYVLQQDVELSPVSRRELRIFLIYSAAAGLYSGLIIYFFTRFINNVFTSHLGNLGYLATAGVLFLFLRKRLKLWASSAWRYLKGAKMKFLAWRMKWWQQGLVVASALLLMVPPTAVKVVSGFRLEAGRRAEIRAAVPGLIAQVVVREGSAVPAGGAIAVLHNPDIETQSKVVGYQLRQAAAAMRAAEARFDSGQTAHYTQQEQRLEFDQKQADWKLDQLTLRAPFAGVISTPLVEQRIGGYLQEGDQLSVFVNRQVMRARVLVRDRDLEDVQKGARVDLKVDSFSFRTFTGQVEQIMPAASTIRPITAPDKLERKGQELANFFEVDMEFPNPDGILREGMTGTARIYGKHYPLAWRFGRAGYRWIHSLIW
jgi:putative peptide zinc metalloprotease protein